MTISMETVHPGQTRLGRWVERFFDLYLRLLAVFFFLFTIYTWLHAVGYWDGPNYRFDTMTRNWKIYTAIMLVLFPVTAVGLWSTLSWGRVVWFMAIIAQSVALLRYGQQLGSDEAFLIFHAVTLGIYAVFFVVLYVINKDQ